DDIMTLITFAESLFYVQDIRRNNCMYNANDTTKGKTVNDKRILGTRSGWESELRHSVKRTLCLSRVLPIRVTAKNVFDTTPSYKNMTYLNENGCLVLSHISDCYSLTGYSVTSKNYTDKVWDQIVLEGSCRKGLKETDKRSFQSKMSFGTKGRM
ncbi:hypothetical protein L9F63_027002, partial [Diploptera punctata]